MISLANIGVLKSSISAKNDEWKAIKNSHSVNSSSWWSFLKTKSGKEQDWKAYESAVTDQFNFVLSVFDYTSRISLSNLPFLSEAISKWLAQIQLLSSQKPNAKPEEILEGLELATVNSFLSQFQDSLRIIPLLEVVQSGEVVEEQHIKKLTEIENALSKEKLKITALSATASEEEKRIALLEKVIKQKEDQLEKLKTILEREAKALCDFGNHRKQLQENREHEKQTILRQQQQQQQKNVQEIENKKREEMHNREMELRQKAQKMKEEEAERTKTKLYFNFDPKDLPCVEAFILSSFPNARIFNPDHQLERPCILFTFIPVNSRIDHTRLPTWTQELWNLAGGYSVVIRVHEESSQSYDDNSMDFRLRSGTPYRQIVLKARYKTKWSSTGIGGNTQEFWDSENCLQTMKELIRTVS